ncbi:hypothetical protein GGI25_006003 [Coemansia spiralis]|uniref:Uncharacterized protein n=2 Tax=Coemansia TaxID=4863 RepID=A0A9W8G2W4_9FUNG|nr:hypothetical protein EDC05_005969 [Coemansia umbellata]KAJ2619065.1 hypothetical protein GGI26_006123 [Coemansia sp. RSA 1358]KAJ2669907.1 hypothetical protein GGI25_006003 [Coemansia spiralis]
MTNKLPKPRATATRRVAGPLRHPARDFACLPPLPPPVTRTYGQHRRPLADIPASINTNAAKRNLDDSKMLDGNTTDVESKEAHQSQPTDGVHIGIASRREAHGLQSVFGTRDEEFVLEIQSGNPANKQEDALPLDDIGADENNSKSTLVSNKTSQILLSMDSINDELAFLPYQSTRMKRARERRREGSACLPKSTGALVSSTVDELCLLASSRRAVHRQSSGRKEFSKA